VINEWLDLTGGRVFLLYEVNDPGVLLAANANWTDIAKVETVPVIDVEEAMKLMKGR